MTRDDALLEVRDLRISLTAPGPGGVIVDGLSFAVAPGEVLGIVGESGCGKTVTARSIIGLNRFDGRFRLAGQMLYKGRDLLRLDEAQMRAVRGKEIAMIFQDPMTSLNPYLRVGEQLIEPLLIHEKISRRDALARGRTLLEEVGIADAARRLSSYPHEFSGGMRQRLMIAMALITRPDLLIADEPTTALDVTVQAQILDLLRRFQRERGMAVIFITHDLGVVAGLCDRVQVMYAGRIVESADTRTLFREPRHPYTRALQRSIPALQAKGVELATIPGMPPDLAHPPAGCAFAPRCEFATERCRIGEAPNLKETNPNHLTACLRVQAGEI